MRKLLGFYENFFPTLATFSDMFKLYMRVSVAQFDDLLSKVGPIIAKQHVIREPIFAGERLSLTLR